MAFFFELQGFFVYRAADVVANMVQLGRLGKFLHDVCSVKLLTMGVNVLRLQAERKYFMQLKKGRLKLRFKFQTTSITTLFRFQYILPEI